MVKVSTSSPNIIWPKAKIRCSCLTKLIWKWQANMAGLSPCQMYPTSPVLCLSKSLILPLPLLRCQRTSKNRRQLPQAQLSETRNVLSWYKGREYHIQLSSTVEQENSGECIRTSKCAVHQLKEWTKVVSTVQSHPSLIYSPRATTERAWWRSGRSPSPQACS